ncbi:hypothetical protein FB451DRAFT_1229234 [Mycena latifolia]|nr:hypothetical protein FB451DRAFT_1229234 [Mycena latifolia]
MQVPRFTVAAAVFALPALLASTPAHAALTNLTIDDTNSTFWTWAGSWSAVTPSTPCPGCFAQPDASKAHDSSWHDGSLGSGSCTFQGSAISIYGIDVINPANISFSLNDPPTKSFYYYMGTDFVYNSLFFAAAGLDPTVPHTVTWSLQASSSGGSAALFDYAILTVDQPDASPSSASPPATAPPAGQPAVHHKPKTGPIVGGVVGGAILLALLGVMLFVFRRRRRRGSGAISIDLGEDEHTAPLSRGHDYSAVSTGPGSESSQLTQVSFSPVNLAAPSTAAPAPVPSESLPSPTASESLTSKAPPAVLAWDRPDSASGRARDLMEVEERLRHLEALAQPPAYS